MPASLVLLDPKVILPGRPADQVLARVFAASLDAALAAGRPPESSRLLAARARHIVAPGRRRALAAHWEHLLCVARQRAGEPRSRAAATAVPLRAGQIVDAAPAIGELVTRLTVQLPVRARGVAMASVLLTDAAGPVYSRCGTVTLAHALDAAISALDPTLPLLSAGELTTPVNARQLALTGHRDMTGSRVYAGF
jgi:hypothetical protein